ncbi:hypothetical protein HDU81_002287 [Chytriomyces hyalinus]|nr:hypothetical protein HDU81_002287 [Chytriomyces hyalinus]
MFQRTLNLGPTRFLSPFARLASSTVRRKPTTASTSRIVISQASEQARQGSYQYFNQRPNRNLYQDKRVWTVLGGAGVLGGVYYVSHLETVPLSGRTRFMDVSEEMEAEMGKQAYKQIMQEYGRHIVPNYHPAAVSVQKVAKRIIAVSGLKDVDWEVYLIDSPEKNAFVIPGGKIFVFSGILPVVQDDDGLAAVLGHEIAHQIARHSAEKLSQMKILIFGQLVLSIIFDAGYFARILIDVGLAKPFSRLTETEADYIGLKLMAQACYNPEAAVQMWRRMKLLERESHQNPYLSTHPSHDSRIEQITEWLPEAQRLREASDCRQTVQLFHLFNRSAFTGQGRF